MSHSSLPRGTRWLPLLAAVALAALTAGCAGSDAPPGTTGAGFQERVAPNSSGRALEVTRHYADGRTAPFSLRVDARDGETWLVREAVLSGPREDLLSNDSARGRLAGALAADLLGWAVMLR